MKRCPRCNTVNEDDATTCVNCGTVLTPQILALVCPRCGKVSPLGTKECPVCQEKLAEQNQKMVEQFIKLPKRKNNFWSLVLLIITSITVIFLGLSFTQIKPVIYVKYVALECIYQDKHHSNLYREYYVAKQNNKERQTTFSVAYLGQGNIGKSKINNVEPRKYAHQYHINPHYEFNIKRNKTVLTGPTRVVLNESQSKIIIPDDSEVKFNTGTFSCRVKDKEKIKYIKILTMTPSR